MSNSRQVSHVRGHTPGWITPLNRDNSPWQPGSCGGLSVQGTSVTPQLRHCKQDDRSPCAIPRSSTLQRWLPVLSVRNRSHGEAVETYRNFHGGMLSEGHGWWLTFGLALEGFVSPCSLLESTFMQSVLRVTQMPEQLLKPRCQTWSTSTRLRPFREWTYGRSCRGVRYEALSWAAVLHARATQA